MLEKLKESSIGKFILELIKRIQEDEVMLVGAQLAYYLIMSFFPFLIFLLNIAAFTPLGQESVMNELFSLLPNDATELLRPIITDIISSKSASLLSFSLILALWSGSNGINALIKAMGKAFDIENNYKPWLKRILSVIYTLFLAIIILLVVAGPVFGESIINWVNQNIVNISGLEWIIQLIVMVTPFILMVIYLLALYKYGPGFPENRKVTIFEALIGAVSATLLFVIISFGFSFYVNNFGNYANTYGALGGIIILLIWLYLGSVSIMIGAEISASYVALTKPIIEARTEDEPEIKELGIQNSQKGLGTAIVVSIGSFILLKGLSSLKK